MRLGQRKRWRSISGGRREGLGLGWGRGEGVMFQPFLLSLGYLISSAWLPPEIPRSSLGIKLSGSGGTNGGAWHFLQSGAERPCLVITTSAAHGHPLKDCFANFSNSFDQ